MCRFFRGKAASLNRKPIKLLFVCAGVGAQTLKRPPNITVKRKAAWWANPLREFLESAPTSAQTRGLSACHTMGCELECRQFGTAPQLTEPCRPLIPSGAICKLLSEHTHVCLYMYTHILYKHSEIHINCCMCLCMNVCICICKMHIQVYIHIHPDIHVSVLSLRRFRLYNEPQEALNQVQRLHSQFVPAAARGLRLEGSGAQVAA